MNGLSRVRANREGFIRNISVSAKASYHGRAISYQIRRERVSPVVRTVSRGEGRWYIYCHNILRRLQWASTLDQLTSRRTVNTLETGTMRLLPTLVDSTQKISNSVSFISFSLKVKQSTAYIWQRKVAVPWNAESC